LGKEKKNCVLIIDDERSNIITLTDILGKDFKVYAEIDSREAVSTAEEVVPDLILLDILMPDMNGYDVIALLKASKTLRDVPVIFITGLDSNDAEEKGLTLGAVDYISKPFNAAIVMLRVRNQINLVNRTRALQERTESLLRLQNSMASVLANMVENRDKLTGKHVEQTAKYIRVLLDAMLKSGLYIGEISKWDIRTAISSSRLHDIGKIAVSDLILNKPGKLTEEEFATIKSHTTEGELIIESIISESGGEEFLHHAKLFAGSHHEWWDGSGYPRGLKGENIPLHGRIMALADVYDALISERPYKPAYPHEKAIEIILEGKGKQFDPKIVDVFLEVHSLFAKVQEALKNREVKAQDL